jgi:hypothetical protein
VFAEGSLAENQCQWDLPGDQLIVEVPPSPALGEPCQGEEEHEQGYLIVSTNQRIESRDGKGKNKKAGTRHVG